MYQDKLVVRVFGVRYFRNREKLRASNEEDIIDAPSRLVEKYQSFRMRCS
jgi:hypothetical protein